MPRQMRRVSPNFLPKKASGKQILAKTACKLVLGRRPQPQGRGKLTKRSAPQGWVGEDHGNEFAQLQAHPLLNKKHIRL